MGIGCHAPLHRGSPCLPGSSWKFPFASGGPWTLLSAPFTSLAFLGRPGLFHPLHGVNAHFLLRITPHASHIPGVLLPPRAQSQGEPSTCLCACPAGGLSPVTHCTRNPTGVHSLHLRAISVSYHIARAGED